MLNNNILNFPNAIQVWLINLKRLNVNVLDICFENLIDLGTHVFQDAGLNGIWNSLKVQLSTEKPIVIQKSEQGYLIGYLLTNSSSSSLIGLSIMSSLCIKYAFKLFNVRNCSYIILFFH